MTVTTVFRPLVASAAMFALATGSAMAADLVRVASPHTVSETADRLVAAVEGAGAKIFLRVDHAAGAQSVGETIPANQVVIFGNPALGTGAIKDAPGMGLDLPLRVQVVDEGGATVMIYHAPASVAADHGLAADHPVIVKMTGALGKLTASAAAE